MKTTKVNLNSIKALVIAIAFMMLQFPVNAQKNSFNFCVNYRNNGNGLGSSIIPQIGYELKSHEFMLGANIQKRSLNISGVNIRYNYNMKRISKVQLFLFCDINYSHNAYLGKQRVKTESFIHPEYSSFYNSYKLNVIDEHAGFGIKFIRSNYFNFYALVGGGSYQTLSPYPKHLFRLRDQFGSSLLLNLGLTIKLTSQHKK